MILKDGNGLLVRKGGLVCAPILKYRPQFIIQLVETLGYHVAIVVVCINFNVCLAPLARSGLDQAYSSFSANRKWR